MNVVSRRGFLLASVIAVCISCDAYDVPTTGSKEVSTLRFPVSIDPLIANKHVVGSRKGEEEAAIQSLLSRVPAEHREQLDKLLRDPFSTPTHAPDVEGARLLSLIASIRAADAQGRVKQGAELAVAMDLEQRVPVAIALVPRMKQVDHIAAIIRRPDDNGVPLLVLPEAASEGDLSLGMRRAISASDKGPVKTSTVVVIARNAPTVQSKPASSDWIEALRLAHSATRSTVRGVGNARLFVAKVSRPGASP